jgi:Heterokaryon incompatibility protein (HET)
VEVTSSYSYLIPTPSSSHLIRLGTTAWQTVRGPNHSAISGNAPDKLTIRQVQPMFQRRCRDKKLLSFRYIWIDTLCIMQDLPSDVQNKCSHMKDIYRNCSVILAADCVKNSKGGLYPVRPESRETSLPFCAASGQQVSWWTLSNRQLGNVGTDVIFGVLISGGWTLQERILAPRTLHFEEAQVHWECPNSIWWEMTDFKCAFYTPSILDEARDAMIEMNRKNLRMTSSSNTSGMGKGCTRYTFWYDLVSAYSCRLLTLPQDRLTAILGLADLLAQNIQDQVVWGLWRQGMPAGSLWTIQATDHLRRLAAVSTIMVVGIN